MTKGKKGGGTEWTRGRESKSEARLQGRKSAKRSTGVVQSRAPHKHAAYRTAAETHTVAVHEVAMKLQQSDSESSAGTYSNVAHEWLPSGDYCSLPTVLDQPVTTGTVDPATAGKKAAERSSNSLPGRVVVAVLNKVAKQRV